MGLQNSRQAAIEDFEGEKDADAPGNPEADPRDGVQEPEHKQRT